MKVLMFLCSFFFAMSMFSQTGRAGNEFLNKIEKEGITYYKFKKGVKKKKVWPAKNLPKEKNFVYNGKNVQLLMLGFTMLSDVSVGNGITTQQSSYIAMLFAKKMEEDHFTYIGYYPDKRDQISITPFKKHGALYLKDYEELSKKVSKKEKGYKRFNAVAVFKEYDEWLSKNK